MKRVKQSLIIVMVIVIFVLGIQLIMNIYFDKNTYADVATSSVATSSNPWNNTRSLIEYYGNGGIGEKNGIIWGEYDAFPYQVKYNGNEVYHYEVNFFRKYGYVFTSWNTQKDGTGLSVMSGEEDMNFKKLGVTAPRYVGYDFFHLYAQWEYKEWLVEFKDYNGNVISRQLIPNGGSATAPPTSLNASTDKGEYIFKNWDRSFTDITQDTIVNGVYDYRASNIDTNNIDTNTNDNSTGIVQNRIQNTNPGVSQTTQEVIKETTQETVANKTIPTSEGTGNKADNIPFSINNRNGYATTSRIRMTPNSETSEDIESEDISTEDDKSKENTLEDKDNINPNLSKHPKAISDNTKTNVTTEDNWFIGIVKNIDRWMDNIVSLIAENPKTFVLSLFIIVCAIPGISFLMFKERKELEVKTPEGLVGYCYYSNSITGKSKVRLNIDNKTVKRTYTTSTLSFVKKET